MSKSLHEIECEELYLNPSLTSRHAVECIQHGLHPKETSIHALQCVKYGLDPTTASIADVDRARGYSEYEYVKSY